LEEIYESLDFGSPEEIRIQIRYIFSKSRKNTKLRKGIAK